MNLKTEEIADLIDQWHDGKIGKDKELHEVLKMSWEEFAIWAIRPSIFSAHENENNKGK